MSDDFERALEVLAQAERLMDAIRRYERTAAPVDYAPTGDTLLRFMSIAPPAIALENALSHCGFQPGEFGSLGRTLPGYFQELMCIHGVCMDVRFSRHAKTQKEKAEVTRAWGTTANGGWGLRPGKDGKLPRMSGYTERLAVPVEELRKILGNKPAATDDRQHDKGKNYKPLEKQQQENTRPKWDRIQKTLTIGKDAIEIAVREAPVMFAVLDLLEAAEWPGKGVSVPQKSIWSLKDAVDSLNRKLAGTRLRIRRLNGNRQISWELVKN